MQLDAKWLQTCWNSQQFPVLTPKQWAWLIPRLRKEQMLARLAFRCRLLDTSELPDYARRHLQNACRLALKQQLQVECEAELLQQLLGELDYCVFLKGAAYSLLAGEVGQGRLYSDIDILIPKQQVTAAEQVLCLHGFIPDDIDPYDDRYYRRWSHEIPPLRHASRGTVLDVHHQIIPPISGRAPDLTQLLQGKRLTSQGFQVLAQEAMFLHSAIHLFCNEEIKYGWRDLLDLSLMLEQDTVDAKRLIELATSTGFASELALALRSLIAQTGQCLSPELHSWLKLQPQQPVVSWCFSQVLQPQLCSSWTRELASKLLTLRGHWMKMPLTILCKHSASKIWRSLARLVVGDAALKPKN